MNSLNKLILFMLDSFGVIDKFGLICVTFHKNVSKPSAHFIQIKQYRVLGISLNVMIQ